MISIKVKLFVLCIISNTLLFALFGRDKLDLKKVSFEDSELIQCIYYNPIDFINIQNYKSNEHKSNIKGCIVPHHLLAKDLIHEVFASIDREKYKTVVIIGPDHISEQKTKIFTTPLSWDTPYGKLKSNADKIHEISDFEFVKSDSEKMTIEHSVSTIIPFIKFYMPDVNVIPLSLTKQTTLDSVEKLSEYLCKNLIIEETLFIASVDFSHYLTLEQSKKMDMESIAAIKDKDIYKIMNFTNDNLDSPMSVVLLLKIMEMTNTQNQHVLNNSNSDIILKRLTEETTSYITYLFY